MPLTVQARVRRRKFIASAASILSTAGLGVACSLGLDWLGR
ncbi:hypothetical protein ACFOPQ_00665 [Deinococcus antarcticus]|uniref:Uncharacterized protein n=1 Tax=Deinococcus antarcticus TaxID=1298767 RepID=A0ABV8A0R3_9DEIO